MKYSKTLDITTDGAVDNPIQVWIPFPKESKFSVKVSKSKPRSFFEGLRGNQFEILGAESYHEASGKSPENIFSIAHLEIPNKAGKYSINLEFDYQPTPIIDLAPSDYWRNKGLEESDVVDYNHELILDLSKKISEYSIRQNIPYSQMAMLYLSRFLEYEENPRTRIASEVAKIMKSDCGGYHSLLCSLERIKGNPALLAFGFWGNVDEVYHTTAYVLDNGKWIQRDLNDQQDNRGVLTPFVPISIGTDIRIITNETPEYPRPVKFLQHSLIWIEGDAPKEVKKTFRLVKE